MSQRELAGRVGSSREAVYRVLAQIADRGLVRADHRCLAVLDLEGLRLLSG